MRIALDRPSLYSREGVIYIQYNEDIAVARLSELLALRLGFPPKTARHIRVAALLHDIGKQRIPDYVQRQTGPLSPEDYDIMKTHTAHGAEMLASVQGDLGGMIRTVCIYHHEWHNGGGYWGMTSEELPAYVFIVAICDVYIALISERPYKKAWSNEDALAHIAGLAGTQFSQLLVETFLAMTRCDRRVGAIVKGGTLEQNGVG